MYVSRDGVKLFYQATGSGSRDVFLLPQCQPATYSRQFKHQIPYLARYFRVITMDPRGNGRSDRPATRYDLDTRYADFLAVLGEVVRPPFALAAVSCAGMLAFRYAVEHPDRVSHLILLSGQYSESVPQPFDEKVAPVIRDDFDGWRQRLFARALPGAPLAQGHRGRRRLGRRDDPGHPRRVAAGHRRLERPRAAGRSSRADAGAARHQGPDRAVRPRPEDGPGRSPAPASSPSRAEGIAFTVATWRR